MRQFQGVVPDLPVEADLVIATPESGTPAAIGYAQASGIPYDQGLLEFSFKFYKFPVFFYWNKS